MARVLVAPHHFEIGGSQLVALELAAEVAREGEHEVVLYAPHGALEKRARATGLELHLSPLRESAPSPGRIRELADLVRRRGIDLVHTYEWAPTVDAAYGARGLRGTPVIATVQSMDYPGFLPAAVPLILGTRELCERARAEGRPEVHLLEPHVDLQHFDPDAVPRAEIAEVRRDAGAAPDELLVVVVGRLSEELKLDGLLALVEACGRLAAVHPLRLALVGDGPARDRVAEAARQANAKAGREVVRLLGPRDDPRACYAAADVVVGMGGSALRAMAMRRPLLVQGERGFWRIADARSLPVFLAQGWYGQGTGEGSVERCIIELDALLRLPATARAALGAWGRDVVAARYGLAQAASELGRRYRETLDAPRPTRGQRLAGSFGLARDIAAHRMAMRHPALQTSFRRLSGR
ncbi:glycosyltransferase [Microbacterium stercoris]|uniref:D-inositol 3-phosphate glycosyltransferase n=1 Tax=Microbacterium stercoris TaxID=2820289 RepID=A0A939TQ98_9MICO|nr:glycosyltransferase [Microbacterium stercoris]MBO3663240.1 glycosyltransferase [Microbacterium stercoris]